jgi:FdhE protein
MFNWNTAIDRARQLAQDVEPARELLTFYVALLENQQHVYDSLRGRRDWLPSGILEDAVSTGSFAGDQATSLPADLNAARLDDASSLATDLAVLREEFPSFLQSVLMVSPSALAHQASTDQTLLLQYWQTRSDELFFAKAFLQPYARWAVESGALTKQPTAPENRCPWCFGKPQLSFLQTTEAGAESGNRNLLCATCLSAWPFRRVVCASCGEERPFKLAYFQSDEFDHVRIEACESCKQYIKGIDLTRLGMAVPLVDDVASAALDLWATEKGYAKIELNLVGV